MSSFSDISESGRLVGRVVRGGVSAMVRCGTVGTWGICGDAMGRRDTKDVGGGRSTASVSWILNRGRVQCEQA